MYKLVRLDARGRAVRLGAQGKTEQWLGRAERLGRVERRLGRAGEAAELCGAAELLGVPLTVNLSYCLIFKKISILESLVSGIRYLESSFWWHLHLLDNTGACPFLWRAGGIFNLEYDVFLIFQDYTNTTLQECSYYVARTWAWQALSVSNSGFSNIEMSLTESLTTK